MERRWKRCMNGLEWITGNSCCASANFLGQLNGLSIPRTRSFNDKRYENVSRRKIGIFGWLGCCYMIGCSSGSDWSAIDVGVCISVRDSDIPCQRFASGPGYLSGPIWALAIRTKKSNWFPGCWHLRSLDGFQKDLVEVRVPLQSFLQASPWRPLASTCLPQGYSWGWHVLVPSWWPTATRMASLLSLRNWCSVEPVSCMSWYCS